MLGYSYDFRFSNVNYQVHFYGQLAANDVKGNNRVLLIDNVSVIAGGFPEVNSPIEGDILSGELMAVPFPGLTMHTWESATLEYLPSGQFQITL